MRVLSFGKLIVLSPWYALKSKKQGDNRSLFRITGDIVSLYYNYRIAGHRYLTDGVGLMKSPEREAYLADCKKRRRYTKIYNGNWAFLAEYADIKYEVSRKKREERKKAYIERFHMGEHCNIQYGVKFISEHHHIGQLSLGDFILFARDSDIDITGDLTIQDGVSISEGAKILTHSHEMFIEEKEVGRASRGYILSQLEIKDYAWIGARAFIHPGVKEIGRRSIIAAGSVVKNKVPPYAIVMGNPAKTVGFVLTLNAMIEFENTHYPEDERIPVEVLEHNYNKYFKNRINEIKEFIKQ